MLAGVFGCEKKDAAPAVGAADAKTVPITVDGKGFTPGSVNVKKGEKTQLLFKRTTDETCAKQVVFPELGVTKDLPLDKTVAVDVPVDAARTLTFQCGMGMFKSKVVID
jgi:plastocyanin domain-containing protein